MKKQKKQSLLNAIIIILVLALFLMIGSIVYEEVINMNKQPIQNTNAPTINENIDVEKEENEDEQPKEDTTIIEDEPEKDIENDENNETLTETEKKEEFVGKEENNTEEVPEKTTDEKVIDLVKREWGSDKSVTFTIEKKNGTNYRVAVRDNSTTVLAWYEVDTQNWNVSEY